MTKNVMNSPSKNVWYKNIEPSYERNYYVNTYNKLFIILINVDFFKF